jgi:hypothetical protein
MEHLKRIEVKKGVCKGRKMALTGSGFLPYRGSFEKFKEKSAFQDLVKSADYVMARPATHCKPSRTVDSHDIDCRKGFLVETYDCTER